MVDMQACRYEFVSAGSHGMSLEEENSIKAGVFNPDNPPWVVFPLIRRFFGTVNHALVVNLKDEIRSNPPDLVVFDVMSQAGAHLAEWVGAPAVMVSSIPLPLFLALSDKYYQYDSALWIPLARMPVQESASTSSSMLARAMRAVLKPLFHFMESSVWKPALVAGRDQLGLPPRQSGAVDHTGLVMQTEAPGSSLARPLPPNLELIGPQLDPELWNLADEDHITVEDRAVAEFLAANGTVLFVSFGTNTQLTKEDVVGLYGALASPRGVRVLWSLPDAQAVHLPPEARRSASGAELLVLPWVNQPAVLHSPNVKAFLTHCGANSVNEARVFGVPLLTVPMGADQPILAMQVVSRSYIPCPPLLFILLSLALDLPFPLPSPWPPAVLVPLPLPLVLCRPYYLPIHIFPLFSQLANTVTT